MISGSEDKEKTLRFYILKMLINFHSSPSRPIGDRIEDTKMHITLTDHFIKPNLMLVWLTLGVAWDMPLQIHVLLMFEHYFLEYLSVYTMEIRKKDVWPLWILMKQNTHSVTSYFVALARKIYFRFFWWLLILFQQTHHGDKDMNES